MIQNAQAAHNRTEAPMAQRVVRSRRGHTLAAPNDDSAAIATPLAPTQAKPAAARRPSAARTRPASPGKPAARTRPTSPPAVPPEAPAEEHSWSAHPCNTGFLRDTHPENQPQSHPTRPQSVPIDPQSARKQPLAQPFDPSAEPDFRSAPPQPQPYEDFTRKPNGMTMMASASSPKPNPPLHLRQPSPAAGEGGPLNSPPPDSAKTRANAQSRAQSRHESIPRSRLSPSETWPQRRQIQRKTASAPSSSTKQGPNWPLSVVTPQLPHEGCRPPLVAPNRRSRHNCSGNPPKYVVFSRQFGVIRALNPVFGHIFGVNSHTGIHLKPLD
jgi:hypothetical protein